MSRKNIHPDKLKQERTEIRLFLATQTRHNPGIKIPMADFFAAYRRWRWENLMGNTRVSLDGFGRLFPKIYKRGPAFWRPAGHSLKCVWNRRIVE